MLCPIFSKAGRPLAALGCAVLALVAATSHAAPFAYISNRGSANVSVIDTATNTVIATVGVGASPWGVAVNPVLRRAYVANNLGNSVSVIDTDTQAVVATVPVGARPTGVAVRSDGTRAYVTNFLDSSVSVIDTSSNAVVATINLGLNGDGPRGIDIQADGSLAYTANETGNSVSQINLATNAVATQVIAGLSPFDIKVSPDGTRAYVSLTGQCSVEILGAGATSVTLFPPAPPTPCGTPGRGMVLDPTTGLLYVGVQIGVKVITGTTLLAFFSTVGPSRAIGIHPGGGRLYGVNTPSNNVTVFDQFSQVVMATVPVGTSPEVFGNFVSPITSPSAPIIGTATPGNGSASIAFAVPVSDGGSPITGYTASCTPGPVTAGGAGSPILVTGLNNGTTYSCSVTATNAIGTSVPSATVSVTPVTVPGAPTIAAAGGNAQATVTITAPASDGGSPITGYTVVSSPAGGVDAAAGTLSTPRVITGLTNGTPYTFTVTATNAIGTSVPSAPSGSVTPAVPPPVAPGAPTLLVATSGNGQATISFSAPASDGGSPITGYTATCNPGAISASGAATSITVTGLANSTLYTCSVTATNGVGPGLPSATTTVTPAHTVFSGASATGSGIATVSFTGGGAGCTFAPVGNGPLQSAFFIPVSGHPKSPPPGSAPAAVAFAHGLLDFVLLNCTPGSTINFTVTYGAALPAAAQYWKYGPTPGNAVPHWYVLPAAIAGNSATFSIVDGGLGDDDLAANGTLVDQGGPGGPGGGAAAANIPTLSGWALMLLASLLLLGAMRRDTLRRGRDA